MKPFAFRQRIGTLDWKTISSLDIEIIIEDNQIEELQSIIDNIIFSEIKNNDVKNTSIIEIKKLINIMQLMLEYLLYCQESQLALIRELHNKNKLMKKYNKELIEQNETIKEDSRIYKRQIGSLKSSIEKYKQMVLKQEGYVAIRPRIFNPLNPDDEGEEGSSQKEKKNNSLIEQLNPLVESMLRHERQTRDFVREIIDEQRSNMLRELDRIYSKSESDRISLTNIENQLNSYTDRITPKIERIAISAANTVLQTLQQQQLQQQLSSPQPSPPQYITQPIISREEIEKQIEEKYKLELKLNEIIKRERKVIEKEIDIEEKLAGLQLKIKEFERNSEKRMKLQKENNILVSSPIIPTLIENNPPKTEIDQSLSNELLYQNNITLATRILEMKYHSEKKQKTKYFFEKYKNVFITKSVHSTKLRKKEMEILVDDNNKLKLSEKELSDKVNKLTETNLKLEKKLNDNLKLIEELQRRNNKPKLNNYDKRNELELMNDALSRIKTSIQDINSDEEEEIMSNLAEELLDRVNIIE